MRTICRILFWFVLPLIGFFSILFFIGSQFESLDSELNSVELTVINGTGKPVEVFVDGRQVSPQPPDAGRRYSRFGTPDPPDPGPYCTEYGFRKGRRELTLKLEGRVILTESRDFDSVGSEYAAYCGGLWLNEQEVRYGYELPPLVEFLPLEKEVLLDERPHRCRLKTEDDGDFYNRVLCRTRSLHTRPVFLESHDVVLPYEEVPEKGPIMSRVTALRVLSQDEMDQCRKMGIASAETQGEVGE